MSTSFANSALVFRGPQQVSLEDVVTQFDLDPHDVIVKIEASTICGTDSGIVTGKYPALSGVIIGHEAAGSVAAIGRLVAGFNLGDPVAIDPTPYCGICDTCRRGFPNHCETKGETETGVSKNGTFTTFYRTSSRCLRRLSGRLSYEAACLTEPTSCVLNAVRQLRLRTHLATAVVGGGPIGMLFCHVLSIHGVRGVVIEQSASRLPLCEKLLPHGWNLMSDWNSALADYARKGKFDLLIDACGAISSQMIDHLHRGGQALVAGLRSGTIAIEPMQLADRSLSLIGSIDSNGTFDEALALIEDKRIPAADFVSHTFSLSQYREAFATLGVDVDRGEFTSTACAMKVVLHPS